MCRKVLNPNIPTRVLGIALVSLVVIAVGTGCGLPEVQSLEPPVNPQISGIDSPGLQILTFQHNNGNDFDDFKGYDLYYKLYPPATSSAPSSLSSDESYIESTPKDAGPDRLLARGFLRLVPVTSRNSNSTAVQSLISTDPYPSIPMSPIGSPITISLDLREPPARPTGTIDTDPSDTEIVASSNDGSVPIIGYRRRNSTNTGVSQPDSEFLGFWDGSSYATTDNDISRMFSTGSFDLGEYNDRITIVIYAITYGIDGTDFRPYYSEPLRLKEGTIVVSNS